MRAHLYPVGLALIFAGVVVMIFSHGGRFAAGAFVAVLGFIVAGCSSSSAGA